MGPLPISRLDDAEPDVAHADAPAADGAVHEPSVPEQYELLLAHLCRAEREWDNGDYGRTGPLEDASSVVFDLLYALDFRSGGELVPRLAGLYGYIGNELLVVGKTRDRARLSHLRDMITTLQQSWYGQSVL
jgi:flagellin-specific chaperone FliS